jgi:hypothetical protein
MVDDWLSLQVAAAAVALRPVLRKKLLRRSRRKKKRQRLEEVWTCLEVVMPAVAETIKQNVPAFFGTFELERSQLSTVFLFFFSKSRIL